MNNHLQVTSIEEPNEYVHSDSPMRDSSVNVFAPVTTSSLINQYNNLMSKKRKEHDDYCQTLDELLNKMKFGAQEDVCCLANKFSLLAFDHDNEKKKRKVEREPVVRNYLTEGLTRFIKNEMDGTYTKLVIQKVLSYNDIKEGQDRLNMPIEKLETRDFLTLEEKKDLEEGKKEIVVRLVGPRLQMYEQPMVLSKCHSNYVLKTNWDCFVEDNKNDLKEDSKIQVWSFRRDLQLCFALIVVEGADVVNELSKGLLMSSIY